MAAIAFYLKIVGLIIWLGNILLLNIGTYASEVRKGCWFHARFHSPVKNSFLAGTFEYHPLSFTFRSVHGVASGLLTAGAIISWLPGFIILNAGGFFFALFPPSALINRFPGSVDRALAALLLSKKGLVISLFIFPLLFSLPGLLTATPLNDLLQLYGAALLLLWYFSCFGGYWMKTTSIAVATFFAGILLLFVTALLAGPAAYPFAVLEGLAALMQGFFLTQELQWLAQNRQESVQTVVLSVSSDTDSF